MNTLFDQTTINGMTLQNRLARSATWEGMCAADGSPFLNSSLFIVNWRVAELGSS